MSSLTISVALLAMVAIAVVAGYNAWLGRGQWRFPWRRPRRAAPAAQDAAAGRAEPSLSMDDAPQPGGEGEPAFKAAPHGTPRDGVAVLDVYTDCIVELALPAPVGAERLAALANGLRRVGSKPVALEGLSVPAADGRDAFQAGLGDVPGEPSLAPEQQWRTPIAGGQYAAIRVGVLLANRHGPLNAMEFSEFVAGVHAMADHLSVLADTPDMTAILARARALDELCASLDAVVGIGVDAGEALGVEDLARLAAECGCVERGNNRHARLGANGEVLFSLALADAPNRLSLLLDVPRAPGDQSPWAEMLACAQLCTERLGGRLVDDAGRPLAAEHLTKIEQQIGQRLQALEDAGFVAGSPLAQRLFN